MRTQGKLSFLCGLLLLALIPAKGDHFRGGTISWSSTGGTDPANFRFRLAYELGKGPGCNKVVLGQHVGKLPEFWDCSMGCPAVQNISDVNYICSSVDPVQGWEQGEDNFRFSMTGPFTVSYTGKSWMAVDFGVPGDFRLQTTGDLRTRTDTGKPNSSPVTASMPVYEIPFGCKSSIQIPLVDPDNDVTVCRWAFGLECGTDCQCLPKSTLSQVPCILHIEPTIQNGFKENGWYKVLLTIEDFPRKDIHLNNTLVSRSEALSTVPLQFIIHTKKFTSMSPCTSAPKIVPPTPPHGTTILVPSNETLTLKLYAKSSQPWIRVKEFITSSPYGVSLSALIPVANKIDVWYSDLSWKPDSSQSGENVFCFQAVDTNNMTSNHHCFIFVAEAKNSCVSAPCQNNGSCSLDLDTYKCDCQAGFTGVSCEQNIDECASDPCHNGGTCLDNNNGFECFCPSGYTGKECKDTNHCALIPCQNFGTCQTSSAGYNCTCLPGYSGNECQTEKDDCYPGACENGGTCEDMVGDFLCHCQAKYTGKGCETEIDYCLPNPCQNGGLCASYGSSYSCSCPSAYLGLNCERLQDTSCSDPEDSYCICNVDGKPLKVPFPESLTKGLDMDDLIAGFIGFPIGATVGAILAALWHFFIRPKCLQKYHRVGSGRLLPQNRPESSASTKSLLGRLSPISINDVYPISSTPLNVYRAGFHDQLSHKTGERLSDDSYIDGKCDW